MSGLFKSIFAAALLCLAFSFKTSAAGNLGLKTVVIDAGHGGKDPGAVSKDGKSYEKDFTLDIAQRLAQKIRTSNPDVKVILTRSTDVFVPLNERAAIANKNNADLFISLHINSTSGKTANGFSVHVLGQSSKANVDLFSANMEICKRENDVVLLEEDYSTKYQGFNPNDPESYIFMTMMQNSHLEQSIQFAQKVEQKFKAGSPVKANGGIHQNPFLVLWKTSMPAVLVEMGFISNNDDLWVLRQASNRDKLAECLYNAFSSYKDQYDASMHVGAKAKKTNVQRQGSMDDLPPIPIDEGPATRPAESKQATKPVESKPTAAKPATTKPAESKPAAKPTESKPAAKPAENKPAAKPADKPATQKPAAATSGPRWGVQVFTITRKIDDKDPRLLGYKPVVQQTSNGRYKYIIGVSSSQEEAKKNLVNIKKKYSDAFVVKISE